MEYANRARKVIGSGLLIQILSVLALSQSAVWKFSPIKGIHMFNILVLVIHTGTICYLFGWVYAIESILRKEESTPSKVIAIVFGLIFFVPLAFIIAWAAGWEGQGLL